MALKPDLLTVSSGAGSPHARGLLTTGSSWTSGPSRFLVPALIKADTVWSGEVGGGQAFTWCELHKNNRGKHHIHVP
jgi:hypothetical protein